MQATSWVADMIAQIEDTELHSDLPELLLLQLNCQLQDDIIPQIWSSVFHSDLSINEQLDSLVYACQGLIDWIDQITLSIDCKKWPGVGQSVSDLVVMTVFHVDVGKQLEPLLLAYLKRVLCVAELGDNVPPEELLRVNSMSGVLQNPLLKLDSLFQEIYVEFVRSELKVRMDHQCTDIFCRDFLDDLLGYQRDILAQRWLPYIFPTICHKVAPPIAHEDLVYKLYYECRRPQLFNIIIDFPDSEAAILDLRKCLNKLSIRSDLVNTLKGEVNRRLLHIGVNTNEVLSAYICAVRALRLLDPSFVAQELVCKPISAYLRNREDAMRSIIDKVIADDGSCDLESELTIPKPVDIDEDSDDEAVDDDEPNNDWHLWTPDPIEAIYHTGLGRRKTDLLSMMAGIYGSQDVFLSDYRTLLAQRLLKKISFDAEKEIRNLEMLKLRFGDHDLHECEVMLRDIQDSKRINNLIAENLSTIDEVPLSRLDSNPTLCSGEISHAEFPLSAYILSAQFWPAFKDETLKLPPNLMSCFDKFTKSFEKQKGNRTLRWLHQLGMVNMEIDLAGTKLEVQVSPLQAVILDHFTRQKDWSLKDLAQEMEAPISLIRRMMTVWLQRGIIHEVTIDHYQLADNPPETCEESLSVLFVEEEAGGSVPSVKGQRAEELQIFWTYIVGMLTNLCSLNLDRIHSMLKMFAMSGSRTAECSREQLKAFLDKKVREKVLLCTDDIYTLTKMDGTT